MLKGIATFMMVLLIFMWLMFGSVLLTVPIEFFFCKLHKERIFILLSDYCHFLVYLVAIYLFWYTVSPKNCTTLL